MYRLFLLVSLTMSFCVFADSASYSGDTTGQPTWDRTFASGSGISTLGPVTYSIEYFSISENDSCSINSIQSGFDGYMLVYANSFDPTSQSTNFVAGDDDGNGGIGTSDIDSITLDSANMYILVTTGFAAGDEGPFTNTVTCPTAIVTIGLPSIPSDSIEW